MFGFQFTILQSTIEYVSTCLPVLGEKVEVIPRHVNTAGIVGKTKSRECPLNIKKLEDWLGLRHLNKRWVRLDLSKNLLSNKSNIGKLES